MSHLKSLKLVSSKSLMGHTFSISKFTGKTLKHQNTKSNSEGLKEENIVSVKHGTKIIFGLFISAEGQVFFQTAIALLRESDTFL